MNAEEPPEDSHRGADAARDGELRRMAAFRIRETANRIATLAHSATDDRLRQDLLRICQELLTDEQGLMKRR